jgi:putative inorganic carbon (hco3(-)) transporter
MINRCIFIILTFLLIFTPLAFGSMEIWAFSIMEIGIFVMIVLSVVGYLFQSASKASWSPGFSDPAGSASTLDSQPAACNPEPDHFPLNPQRAICNPESDVSHLNPEPGTRNPQSDLSHSNPELVTCNPEPDHFASNPEPVTCNPEHHYSSFLIPALFLALFFILVLFQLLPLPAGLLQSISPNTIKIRQALSIPGSSFSLAGEGLRISFVPFATEIELFKWIALAGFFFFLLRWNSLGRQSSIPGGLMTVIMLVGVAESLYGMIEFFSGHRHVLYLDRSSGMSSVMGTFINRNYFAGYLLMVIPLTVGFLFSRQARRLRRVAGWRRRLSDLDGKSLLIGYCIVLMIIALLFSASRMGIISLLVSFTIISVLFRDSERGETFSTSLAMMATIALVWAGTIGLDAVISRFFEPPETLWGRWEIWRDTWKIVKDFPFFGSGLGTFAQVFPGYRAIHIEAFFTHAENDFLQLASEVGLVGAVFLAVVLSYILVRGFRGIRSASRSDPRRYIAMGSLVGALALLFHSTVERNIQVPGNAFLLTFLLALVFRIGTTRRKLKA